MYFHTMYKRVYLCFGFRKLAVLMHFVSWLSWPLFEHCYNSIYTYRFICMLCLSNTDGIECHGCRRRSSYRDIFPRSDVSSIKLDRKLITLPSDCINIVHFRYNQFHKGRYSTGKTVCLYDKLYSMQEEIIYV